MRRHQAPIQVQSAKLASPPAAQAIARRAGHPQGSSALSGQRSAALQQYERCRRILHDELGVEPEAETTALYHHIRAAELGAQERAPATAVFRPPSLHLPAPPAPLIGRTEQVVMARDLLLRDDVRLVTLTGPPGIGKTRLAMEIARELRYDFEDGVFFVALAAVSDPTLVIPTIARALGVAEASAGESGMLSFAEHLNAHLHARQMLLVLDNFEQILPAAVDLANLLAACSEVKILVTSQAVLRVRAERQLRVPPLSLPEPGPSASSPMVAATVGRAAAVALFLERAQAVEPTFMLTDANAPAITGICRRLDELPLSIELVAACVTTQPTDALLRQSHSRLTLLAGGLRDLPPRHQTLRDAIGWSYDLLTAHEQILFARLGVFAGGCTAEAAASVAGEGETVIWALQSLCDRSLIRQAAGDQVPRFTMLETLREYAVERLHMNGENETVCRRHAGYFLILAEASATEWEGAEESPWPDRLEEEHDNLRAALAWSTATPEAEETALRLVAALWRFWDMRGYLSEGRRWLERVLAQVEDAGAGPAQGRVLTLELARAHEGAGLLASRQSDYTPARAHLEQSLALYGTLVDSPQTSTADSGLREARRSIAGTLIALSTVLRNQGDAVQASAHGHASLALYRELGDRQGIAAALTALGTVALHQREYETAQVWHEESLALYRELAHEMPGTHPARRGIARALNSLGEVAQKRDHDAMARTRFEASLELYRELGDKQGIALTLSNLGATGLDLRDYQVASGWFEESLALYRELEDRRGIAWTLNNLGMVAMKQGDYARANAYSEQSLALHRQAAGLPWAQRGTAWALENLAIIAANAGDDALARARYAESLALYRELDDGRSIAAILDSLDKIARNERVDIPAQPGKDAPELPE